MTKRSPFKCYKASPEIIRLAVMPYVRLAPSLRNVEDLLHGDRKCTNPEVRASIALTSEVEATERRGELQTWPRPPISEFSDLLNVLGDEIHMMFRGAPSIDHALSNPQNRIDAIMRERGHY